MKEIPLPAIEAPSAEVVAELLRQAAEKGITAGRIYAHDAERGVFVTLTLLRSIVVNWTVEPSPTVEHARALQRMRVELDKVFDKFVNDGGSELARLVDEMGPGEVHRRDH